MCKKTNEVRKLMRRHYFFHRSEFVEPKKVFLVYIKLRNIDSTF